jgi:hypothetical protein
LGGRQSKQRTYRRLGLYDLLEGWRIELKLFKKGLEFWGIELVPFLFILGRNSNPLEVPRITRNCPLPF